jgi:cytochrome c
MRKVFASAVARIARSASRGRNGRDFSPGLHPQSGLRLSIASLLAMTVGTNVALAADAARGKALFQTCAACHTDKPDAIGPTLRGVYGRKSAALTDFRYSNPMTRTNLLWDEANLRDYIKDPQAVVKGTRMSFGGLTDPKEVDDVIAYLKEYK